MTDLASSDILCREITQQSENEAATILEQARKDADQILKTAQADAQKEREKVLAEARTQATAESRRVLSGVHLEVKKQTLRNREAVIARVFDAVRKELENFRKEPNYDSFLESLIFEGIFALESDRFKLCFGKQEADLFESKIRGRVIEILSGQGRSCTLDVSVVPESEGGVLILSEDGRMSYDNRFSARLKRLETDMRLEVMKHVFAD